MAKKSLARTTISIGANIAGLQRGLKTASASIKRFGGQAKRIGTTFTAAFSAPIAAIGTSAVKTFATFEAEMSKVKAVSGATAAQFEKLESEAKRLGATTTFTASEVAGLQVEFAKLGFTAPEIEKVTESTLYLAQAAGADLARAAEVAGATLRGFGMDASETGHLTDVMAKSFSESALDMESFAEAMKYVAPVANAAGIGVEETTAMIELLANAGIKGSQAGTSLRRIISELGATGGDVAGAIKNLANQGLNLADAKDEVGRSAQSALLVLGETIDQLPLLKEGLIGADGAARDMAATMMDNTAGAFKTLQSATEGALIELGDAIANNEIFQDILEGLTEKIGKVTEFIRGMSDAELYNKTVLAGLIAFVPIVIAAVGSLTLAFGSLTAAMGPLGLAVAGVILLYQNLKKEVDSVQESVDAAVASEDQQKSLEELESKYELVNKAIVDQMKAMAKYRKNYSNPFYTVEDSIGYKRMKESLDKMRENRQKYAEGISAIKAKQEAANEVTEEATQVTEEFAAVTKESLVPALAAASMQIELSEDALHRLGQKFGENQLKALSYTSTTNEGMKQAIDLTGGLAYEFSTNLGNAIAGAIVHGESFADSFITALKAMAAQLIATIALVAILATLLVVATGGLAGLSMESLLVGMKAVSASSGISIPFLAEGGIVTSPTLAMIGEGREAEAVIPLSKLPQMAGAGGTVTVVGKLSGQDILLSSEKAQRTRSRYRGF